MAYGKKNVIQIDPLKFSLCLIGESKVGKSTLIYEYCKKLAGEDGYLFIETGSERGADAISGINYVNTPEWEMDYDEYSNSVGFEDVCEDIIENKNSEYKDLRVVVIDTFDQLIQIAEQQAINLWNKELRKNGKPTISTINQSWSGYGRGEKKAMELMFDMRNRLLQVGVQTIYISHCKKKDVTDVVSGETYQVLTSDQQQNYFNALKKDLHFLALAYIDRTIIRENSNKKDKNGNPVKIGKLTNESRRIKFRDDNYAVDSGSRFADIEPDIPMDVDIFISTITDAIEKEAKKGEKSLDAIKKEQEAKDKKREAEIAELEEQHKKEKELQKICGEIKEFVKEAKEDKNKMKTLKKIVEKSKELGYEKPYEIDDIQDAKLILALCK